MGYGNIIVIENFEFNNYDFYSTLIIRKLRVSIEQNISLINHCNYEYK